MFALRISAIAFTLLSVTLPAQRNLATVPFVGCPSDGQLGPISPPHGAPRHFHIPARTATQLAWFKGENSPGVLGPRGWHCFSTYGSNGGSLFLAPLVLASSMFFSDKSWKGFDGPAIQISTMLGDTSGRFTVAETIARLFPLHRDFALRVRDEGLLVDELPTGPATTDQLHYVSTDIVEFVTPANMDGEGTHSRLLKSDRPIIKVVFLTGEELNCTTLSVRLPPALADLAAVIIKQAEQ